MKIGFNFVGISYDPVKKRDWRNEKESFQKQVIDCWGGNHKKIVKLTTYGQFSSENKNHPENSRWTNPTINEMRDFFKPNEMLLLDYKDSTQIGTYAKSLSLWEFEDVDLLISTRFDIKFNNPVNFNTDLNKINFLFREGGNWWNERKYVCDNLFIIPKKLFYAFNKAMKLQYAKPAWDFPLTHGVYNYLLFFLKEEDIHFMFSDMNCFSHENPYYKLLRQH